MECIIKSLIVFIKIQRCTLNYRLEFHKKINLKKWEKKKPKQTYTLITVIENY